MSTDAISDPALAERDADASVTSEEMHRVLFKAITEHVLRPGTKLREGELAEAFGVSRTRIRELLFRLNHLGIVDLPPRRTAIVAKPTEKNAREVFHARRVLEMGIVSEVAGKATTKDIARLRETLAKEKAASNGGDRAAAIRYSGEFHVQMSELLGNSTLTEILRGLVSRTSLVLAVFPTSGLSSCDCDNHANLLKQIASKNRSAAVEALCTDLDDAERSLAFVHHEAKQPDLKKLVSRYRGLKRPK
jgi:DNA-binding GntR family transcriptional regulator